jgi:hypothetical protein
MVGMTSPLHMSFELVLFLADKSLLDLSESTLSRVFKALLCAASNLLVYRSNHGFVHLEPLATTCPQGRQRARV